MKRNLFFAMLLLAKSALAVGTEPNLYAACSGSGEVFNKADLDIGVLEGHTSVLNLKLGGYFGKVLGEKQFVRSEGTTSEFTWTSKATLRTFDINGANVELPTFWSRLNGKLVIDAVAKTAKLTVIDGNGAFEDVISMSCVVTVVP